MKPQTTLLQKALLVLFGLCLGFLVLEGGLRLAGLALARAQERANLASLQKGGAYRVLCLGESTTQKQYPPFLEAALNRGGGGRRFSVLDGGASGINTDVILGRLEPYLEEFRPDLVVAMMGINDHGAAHLPEENPAGDARFPKSLETYKLARLLFHFFFRAGRWNAPPPADTAAYAETGLRYTYEGKIKLAERHFQAGLLAHPGDDRLLAGLGWAYLQECLRGEAETELKKALRANPDNELAHFALGRLYSELRRPAQAEEHYRTALRLNPANYRAYVGLGKVSRGRGDLEQAEAYFRKAEAMAPGDDRVHTVLGQLYAAQNKPELAKEQFKKALRASPGNDKAYSGLEFLGSGPGSPGPAAAPYSRAAASLNSAGYKDLTARNYRALKAALDKRQIRLVCVQYPMRALAPLKNIFAGQADGVVFVDNEKVFGEAVRRDGAAAYFWDMFGGNFGHCTPKGNKLLGENIAGVILREVFGLPGAAVQGAPGGAAL